ncbi:MAG: glycosyltransferase family 2 protein [Candidatus Howiella sp.]|jgi:GT2 family glycosyltransferase
MMDLSICVVTYNSRDEISLLLDSVFSLTSGITFQVYVVDNCSADGTADFVEEKYPDVRVIRSKENAGFGHGHNQALAYLDSRYHAVINPDIRLVEDVFSPLIAYLDSHSDCVLATPRILSPDGSEQKLPKRLPKLQYMFLGRLGRLFPPFQKYRDAYTRANEIFEKPTEIEFCTGCFMLLRTEVFRALNGFDERFFMYLEDADLSRRAAAYGKLIFYPGVSAEHRWARASGKSFKFLRIHLDSIRKYRAKLREEKRAAGK